MKTIFWVTLFSTLLLAGNIYAQSPGPPDAYIQLANLHGWEIVEENRVDLKAPSGNFGTWERWVMTFKDAVKTLEINVFRGTGPGPLYIPEGKVSEDDRPTGFGATYETVTIEGYRGIMEIYPYIGKALTVRLAPDITLCLESRNFTIEELRNIATAIIAVEKTSTN